MNPTQSAKERILTHLSTPDYPYSITRALRLNRVTVKIALLELQAEGRVQRVAGPAHAPKGPPREYYQAI